MKQDNKQQRRSGW